MNIRSNFFSLILLDALEDENASDVFTILEKHLDITFVPEERGISPLHYACGMENESLAMQFLQYCLNYSVDTNVRSQENMTPLHIASIYGRMMIVSMLLDNGAQWEVFDDNQKTPLMYAIEENNFEVVQIIQDHKLKAKKIKNPDSVINNRGMTCLKNQCCSAEKYYTPEKSGRSSSTPDRIYYNHDKKSPFYINITHRRDRPQPIYPTSPRSPHKKSFNMENCLNKTKSSPTSVQAKNIFALTRENIRTFSHKHLVTPVSNVSNIESWRQKVHFNQNYQSKYRKISTEESLENRNVNTCDTKKINTKSVDLHESTTDISDVSTTQLSRKENPKNTTQDVDLSNNFPIQITEKYIHTDDENGLIFYETKRLVNNSFCQVVRNSARSSSENNENQNDANSKQFTNVDTLTDYETDTLRMELKKLGEIPGPITKNTKILYQRRLKKLKNFADHASCIAGERAEQYTKFSIELQRTVQFRENFLRIADYTRYEKESMLYFSYQKEDKQFREGHLKQSFIYMLIDPRISCNLPEESTFLNHFDIWKRFLESIFYVGKGKTSRPYSHLYDAMKKHSQILNKKKGKQIFTEKNYTQQIGSGESTRNINNKIERILDIWKGGSGVVCLHVFHNILPVDAYTREAAIIDALSLQHLTNIKRGNYYGIAKVWPMKNRKHLGIALLYKAMLIYLAEGESQLSPSDLI